VTIGLDLEVTSGKLRAIQIPNAFLGGVVVNGPCRLCGFSVRDVTSESTVNVEGAVVAPAGLATIATTGALAGGTYDVNWLVGLAGAAAAADVNNFRLVAGGVNVEASVNPAVAGDYQQISARVTVTAGQVILVQAVGAGTAGVTYSAELEILPVTIALSTATLQDGGNDLAHMATVNGGVDRAWFGTEGIEVYNRINFSPVAGLLSGSIFVRYDRYGD